MEKKWLDSNLSFKERVDALLAEMTIEEKLDQLNYRTEAIPRLGITPYVWWNEALHGLARSGAATVFPQAIAMAATFSPETVEKIGEVIATEGRARHHECVKKGDFGAYKGLTYFSPNVNIFRDPRWGRGHETYGECPFLTGLLGAAYVKGLQGKDPGYFKAVATAKHYAVHSGPEATRLSFNSVTDERDLRETYLPAFKSCIEEGVFSVMTAYNAYNGTPCGVNDYLINTVLRDEWEFKGVIVTDAGAGEALYKEHRFVKDYPEALAKELNTGIDVIIDSEDGAHEAYKRGLISEELIDRAVGNQLMLKFKLGFFDPPEKLPFPIPEYEVIECPEHLELARQASRESLVLMKNEGGILPLNPDSLKSIAVIGPNADNKEVLLGNYCGTPTVYSTLLQGIQKLAPENCRVWYAKGCEHISPRTEPCAEDYDRLSEAVSAAERSDVAIMCLGLSPTIEGEAGDAFNAEAGGDRLRIELPEIQDILLKKVLATGTPVIVLMLTGSAVISPVIEEKVPAMLHCWYPGAEGGEIIAETIFGKTNPSGRLPVTFYKSTQQLPDFNNYEMEGRTYRFFKGETAYPFGFGLSYTDFEYSNLKTNLTDSALDISVNVKNTGKMDGDELVQVYISLKQETTRTPQRSLSAVKRVSLKAGEERTVELSVKQEQLSVINADGKSIAASGECLISVGGSQNDERSIALMKRKPQETKVTL